MEANGLIRVFFENGVTLPDEYNFPVREEYYTAERLTQDPNTGDVYSEKEESLPDGNIRPEFDCVLPYPVKIKMNFGRTSREHCTEVCYAKRTKSSMFQKLIDDSCMKKRNGYMVQNSDYCICALLHEGSGTGQTVRLARKKELKIINVAKK